MRKFQIQIKRSQSSCGPPVHKWHQRFGKFSAMSHKWQLSVTHLSFSPFLFLSDLLAREEPNNLPAVFSMLEKMKTFDKPGSHSAFSYPPRIAWRPWNRSILNVINILYWFMKFLLPCLFALFPLCFIVVHRWMIAFSLSTSRDKYREIFHFGYLWNLFFCIIGKPSGFCLRFLSV